MRARTILRIVMVGLAGGVSLVIYTQWRPSSEVGEASSGERPELSIRPTGSDRAAESATFGLSFRKSDQERVIFDIRAREHVDFVDGWNEWTGPELEIQGREEGNQVGIVAERMRTTGPMHDPDEVRLLGEVVATLPKGGTFSSNRVDFDAVTGLVSTCRRSTLLYAGLDVRSDCLEFQTAGDVSRGDGVVPETLRMWGDLGIQSAAEDSGLPAGLAGGAEEMQFRPGGEKVFLNGSPRLNFTGTSIRGDAIELDMNLDSNELRSIDTRGQARLRYDPNPPPPASEAPGEGGESGSIPTAQLGSEVAATTAIGADVPSRRSRLASAAAEGLPALAEPEVATPSVLVLRADRLQVAFGGSAQIGEILALSESSEPAGLTLGTKGRLGADEIVLTPGDDRQRVVATGGVSWSSEGEGALGDLTASTLELVIAGGQLQRLEASGQVTAEMTSGGEQRSFSGRRLLLEWIDGEMVTGQWPEGARFNADGRRVVAGAARYESDDDSWRLSGPPVPTVSDASLTMSSPSIRVGAGGGVVASDSVELRLGGDLLAAAGPLFGTATAVDVKAGEARISELGVLNLEDRVEVIWQDQSLVAGELRLETSPGRLQASGNVELVVVAQAAEDLAVDPPLAEPRAGADSRGEGDAQPAAASSRFITVSAANMLVEEESAEIRLAGSALLRHGARRIRAERLVVQLDDQGEWQTIRAEGAVEYRDADATATGVAMTYDLQTGAFVLEGTDEVPAMFVYNGIQYHSNESLGVRFNGEEVTISTSQDGRTQTRVVARQ